MEEEKKKGHEVVSEWKAYDVLKWETDQEKVVLILLLLFLHTQYYFISLICVPSYFCLPN